MSFFVRKYVVTDYHGRKHLLTAKQLYERIMQDSKHDYNWLAPARELVRICKKAKFPEEYAIPIKTAILNCFANIEHRANCGEGRYNDNQADREAVQYCYNSLYGINTEKVVSTRKKYLNEIISTATYVCVFSPNKSLKDI